MLAAYPVTSRITTRVADMDGYGRLNAIRLCQFYEDSRAGFYRAASASGSARPSWSTPRTASRPLPSQMREALDRARLRTELIGA